MSNPGFYRAQDNTFLLYAPDYVIGPGFELFSGAKDSYTYPVNGWYWFDSQGQAEDTLGLLYLESPTSGDADWDRFNALMLADVAFQQDLGAVLQIAPAVAIAIPAALSQVTSRGVNSFRFVYQEFVTLANSSSATRSQWAAYAVTCRLPSQFVEII